MIYRKPPITEAIFDIRVDQLMKPGINAIKEIETIVKTSFPDVQKKFQITGNIAFDHKTEQVSHSEKSNILGLIFSTPDKKRQFQARLDGFTVNMLEPYTNWSDFSALAFDMWTIYNQALLPNKVTRIALRFINKIYIPVVGFKDFDDYFEGMPKIPNNLPQTFSGFFVQTIIPLKTPNLNTAVTQTIEPLQGEFLPFLLDIDVFKVDSFEKSDLITNFNELREYKNLVFESYITDKTRELFK